MQPLIILNESDNIPMLNDGGDLAVIQVERRDIETGNTASVLNRLLPLSDRLLTLVKTE